MSTGTRYSARDAHEAYVLLRANLLHVAERLELAGSLRRLVSRYGCIEAVPLDATVGDLEVVTIPAYEERADPRAPLTNTISVNLLRERVRHAYTPWDGAKNEGLKAWKIAAPLARERGVVKCEVYSAAFDTFGGILAYRTGPRPFNEQWARHQRLGGWLPNNVTLRGGRVYVDGEVVATPEEADFFAVLGLPYLEPHERSVEVMERLLAASME
jgi:hypothetical protein